MATLRYKMLHVTPTDGDAWGLLTRAYAEGWRIEWQDYANRQYHFLLVGDPDASV